MGHVSSAVQWGQVQCIAPEPMLQIGMEDRTPMELPSEATMPVVTGKSEQVAIRLPHDAIERTKALRDAFTRPGLAPPSVAEVMRAIFGRGLDAWEKELGLGIKAGTAKARTAKAAKAGKGRSKAR